MQRAPGIPCALCYRGPKKIHANLGRLAPRDRGVVLDVIARSDLSAVAQRAKVEATKQSTLQFRGNMDCFAQPVIGRAFEATRWLAMTVSHNSLALENANDDTRRVFSSRIKVRVIGGSARWLQFSRSQSRQLTPIGVPSAFSRSIPVA